MRGNLAKTALATLGFAVILFLSCADNYPVEFPSEEDVFGTSSSSSLAATSGTFTDSRDNKSYKWVKIGTQTWMAENLKFAAIGSRCYDNEPANCEAYGMLYNWETAKTACPTGWHLSSEEEWQALLNFVSVKTGTRLKSESRWNTDECHIAGTDNYGFNALPGGNCDSDGNFSDAGSYGYWWSSESEYYDYNYAYYRIIFNCNDLVYWGIYGKSNLRSVRCLQDQD